MSLRDIYNCLEVARHWSKNYPYTLRWLDDSITLDYDSQLIEIKPSKKGYKVILPGKDSFEKCGVQEISGLLAEVGATIKNYYISKKLTTVINTISEWVPIKISWNNLSEAEIVFADRRYTVEYDVQALTYLCHNREFYVCFFSVEELGKGLRTRFLSDISKSTQCRCSLLECEYLNFNQNEDSQNEVNLIWLVIRIINQNTELLIDKIR